MGYSFIHTVYRAMSEAQYICSGDYKGESDLTHYGLGLSRYTHFTSPIRRYADVIVHRQLLASLESEQKLTTQPFTGKTYFQAKPIVLPESKVISIIKGEGLNESSTNMARNTAQVVDGTSYETDIVLRRVSSPTEPASVAEIDTLDNLPNLFAKSEISLVCQSLNSLNRMAKVCDSQQFEG